MPTELNEKSPRVKMRKNVKVAPYNITYSILCNRPRGETCYCIVSFIIKDIPNFKQRLCELRHKFHEFGDENVSFGSITLGRYLYAIGLHKNNVTNGYRRVNLTFAMGKDLYYKTKESIQTLGHQFQEKPHYIKVPDLLRSIEGFDPIGMSIFVHHSGLNDSPPMYYRFMTEGCLEYSSFFFANKTFTKAENIIYTIPVLLEDHCTYDKSFREFSKLCLENGDEASGNYKLSVKCSNTERKRTRRNQGSSTQNTIKQTTGKNGIKRLTITVNERTSIKIKSAKGGVLKLEV